MHRDEPRVDVQGTDAIVEGIVEEVGTKKILLESAAAMPGVEAVIDHVRVRPAVPMSDPVIRDRLRTELLATPELDGIDFTFQAGAEPPQAGRPLLASPEGSVFVRVKDGAVTFDGDMPSRAHKRLAGVLAWWVAGVSDVVNAIGVEPPEEDSDGEIVDAVRLVLEKDRLLDASRIRVSCARSVVRLEGAVPTSRQRHMAGFDAWCVFGVDRVENALRIPGEAT